MLLAMAQSFQDATESEDCTFSTSSVIWTRLSFIFSVPDDKHTAPTRTTLTSLAALLSFCMPTPTWPRRRDLLRWLPRSKIWSIAGFGRVPRRCPRRYVNWFLLDSPRCFCYSRIRSGHFPHSHKRGKGRTIHRTIHTYRRGHRFESLCGFIFSLSYTYTHLPWHIFIPTLTWHDIYSYLPWHDMTYMHTYPDMTWHMHTYPDMTWHILNYL